MKYFLWLLLALLCGAGSAQSLDGVVLEEKDGKTSPLFMATVRWLNTGVGTTTDTSGQFSIRLVSSSTRLVVSYTGYRNDTIVYGGEASLRIVLTESFELAEVEVTEEKKSMTVSSISAIKTEIMNENEFKKAACCNLSESFETNPSVDVNFSDAVTGVKQIQMLGLSGMYTQTNVENMPGVRGLSANYGLSFIPGSWIESVQLSKGTGSVANGYESMTGQINIELRKPEEKPSLLINGYSNLLGRNEANIVYNTRVNKHWYTGILSHASVTQNRNDMNGDGFLNFPNGRQFNLMNRWAYHGAKGWEGQLGVKVLDDERISGQISYRKHMQPDSLQPYGINVRTRQAGVFSKFGYVFKGADYKSVGLMFSANVTDQQGTYGLNRYNGTHRNLYFNAIYQSILGNTNHKYRAGVSFMADDYAEGFNQLNFARQELVPGAFAEYTNSSVKRLTFIAGLRGDYNSLFGFFATPRLHAKYDLSASSTLRASVGRGQRTANVFTENPVIFVSSRELVLPANTSGAYGLKPEVSWNYGLNYTWHFKAYTLPVTFSADLYHNRFENQVVVDMDQSARKVVLYNLAGESYSTSAQLQLNLEPVKRMEVRLSYRWYDVKTTYNGQLLQRPYVAGNRGFLNLAYTTRKKWSFDYTLQYTGTKRIPALNENPENLRMPDRSPQFFTMNAQVSKTFRKKWEVYAGLENITNYLQHDLIVDAGNPYGQYFDASMVWGPTMGRTLYLGFRYTVK